MSRYIDADALIMVLNAKADMAMGTPKEVFFSVAKMVELLPAADVVEVVRCKDCKHWNEAVNLCKWWDACTEGDEFCNHGKTKGGEQ